MRHSAIKAVLVGIALVCAVSTALVQTVSQSTPDDAMTSFGPTEYEQSCAACHGPTGKGNGWYRAYLVNAPTDLTTLAKRNGGVFPSERLCEIIDGRRTVPAHGTREMPIWGTHFIDDARGRHLNAPSEMETYTRIRISWLVDYLALLQVK